MKLFSFNVKMAASNGKTSFRVIGAVDVPNIAALAELLNKQDFIVVEKFHENGVELSPVGPEILSQRAIGTVREYKKRVSSAQYED